MLARTIDKQRLRALIAHADAMCLLDGVDLWDEERICCHSRTHLAADNPLREGGKLAAVHALEYAAQAIAVHASLLATPHAQTAMPGMLGSLRKVRLFTDRLDARAEFLRVEARCLLSSGDGSVYAFDVRLDEHLAASGQATVFVPGASHD